MQVVSDGIQVALLWSSSWIVIMSCAGHPNNKLAEGPVDPPVGLCGPDARSLRMLGWASEQTRNQSYNGYICLLLWFTENRKVVVCGQN